MNIVQQDWVGDQLPRDYIPSNVGGLGFCARMEELGELLLKREILRMIFRELKPDSDDINVCLHLRNVERAAEVLDRRITIARNCLVIGVLS